MQLPVSSLCGACLGLMYTWMSLRVAFFRRRNKISIGDGGNKTLAKMVRGHGNFIEYVPIFLILLILTEMQGMGILGLICALIFMVGRIFHAAVFFLDALHTFRVYGMIMTISGIMTLGSIVGISGAYSLVNSSFGQYT